jgi:cytochrome c
VGGACILTQKTPFAHVRIAHSKPVLDVAAADNHIRKGTLMKNFSISALALAVALLSAGHASAADVKKGKRVFAKCKACHVVNKEKNKIGPHLVGIIGRAAGSVDGYKYSKAMRTSGLVWDEETLALYLKAPKKFVKGTKMAFAGLRKENDIANVIAYLKEATK